MREMRKTVERKPYFASKNLNSSSPSIYEIFEIGFELCIWECEAVPHLAASFYPSENSTEFEVEVPGI